MRYCNVVYNIFVPREVMRVEMDVMGFKLRNMTEPWTMKESAASNMGKYFTANYEDKFWVTLWGKLWGTPKLLKYNFNTAGQGV